MEISKRDVKTIRNLVIRAMRGDDTAANVARQFGLSESQVARVWKFDSDHDYRRARKLQGRDPNPTKK